MAEHIVIGDIAPRVQYVASGAQTAFTFPFPIFKPADLEVYLGGERIGGGYVVTGAGQSAGGTVTFAVPPPAGTRVTLRRRLRIERLSDFQENGELRARVLNDELDYQTAALQQVADDLGRALQFGPTDIAAMAVLPPRPARASRLLGFDASGALRLYPAEAGTTQGLFRQDGAGAVPRTVQDKFAEAFSVADFGAAGDNLADDTEAIQAAFDAAATLGRSVLIPEGDWRIRRGLVLPAAVPALVMRGRLVLDPADPAAAEPALALGDGGAVRAGEKLYWGIRVVRTVLAPWAEERAIGVELRNVETSLIHIAEVERFAIGVRFAAEEGTVADNTVILGRLADNRIGLDLHARTAAARIGTNRFLGGRFAVGPAVWPEHERFGVRLAAAAGAERPFEAQLFEGPAFTLSRPGEVAAIPFLVAAASRGLAARGIRMEGCSPFVARHLGEAEDHLYEVVAAEQGYLVDIDYGAAVARAGAALAVRARAAAHLAATRPVAVVPNLRAAAFRWATGQTGFDRLACVNAAPATPPAQLADCALPALGGYALTDRGVVIGAGRGLGFVVDTRACRDFALAADADAPRLFVQCFDAAGALLGDAAGPLARASGNPLVWNAAARWWQGAAELADATLDRLQAVRLAPEVATAIIGICRADRDYEARALALFCDPRHAPALLYGTAALPHGGRDLLVETAWDPPALAAGATVQLAVTVPGAAAGDFAQASFSAASAGVLFLATVSAANTVTVVAWNRTAAAIDLPGGTLRVRVTKA